MSVILYDGNMVPLQHFCQWDQNRVIKVSGLGLTEAPSFRFYNAKSSEARVVPGTLADGIVTAQVPNALLEEAVSLVASVMTYTSNGQERQVSSSSLASYEETLVCSFRIPVIPNPKPEDYLETENIEYVSWVKLQEDTKAIIADLEAAEEKITHIDIKRRDDNISVTFDGTTWTSLFALEDIRSSRWFSGTAITGTSTTPTVFDTGIADARVDDYYINTDTTGDISSANVYKCTLKGDAATAQWVYVCNVKGATGTFQVPTATLGIGYATEGNNPKVSVVNSGTLTNAKFEFTFDNLRPVSPTVSLSSNTDGYISCNITDYTGSRTDKIKACITPKGQYSSTETYQYLDLVYQNYKTYIAAKDVPANTPVTNTEYWMQLTDSTGLDESDTMVFDCGTSTDNI